MLVLVKMPCQLGGVEDKKGLEVSLMGGTSESEEHSAMRSLLASLPILCCYPFSRIITQSTQQDIYILELTVDSIILST